MKLKIGICQNLLGKVCFRRSYDEPVLFKDKFDSINRALCLVRKAKNEGVKIAVLGEMFICPYEHRAFHREAELLPCMGTLPPYTSSTTAHQLSTAAKDLNMFIVGGSIPELSNSDRLYNTSMVFDNNGVLIGKYRKAHLFDVNIPGDANGEGISFKESDTFAPGNLPPCVVTTPWGFDIGVGICFDVRFPELSVSLRRLSERTKLIVFPSAFNMTTGPMHWALLAKARALDTQSYVAMASTARSSEADVFKVWGHSLLASPYGEVVGELDENEGILIHELDLEEVDRIRQSIPLMQQRRSDIYIT